MKRKGRESRVWSLPSVSQFVPEYPVGQLQMYPEPNSDWKHTPPFKHGSFSMQMCSEEGKKKACGNE